MVRDFVQWKYAKKFTFKYSDANIIIKLYIKILEVYLQTFIREGLTFIFDENPLCSIRKLTKDFYCNINQICKKRKKNVSNIIKREFCDKMQVLWKALCNSTA